MRFKGYETVFNKISNTVNHLLQMGLESTHAVISSEVRVASYVIARVADVQTAQLPRLPHPSPSCSLYNVNKHL